MSDTAFAGNNTAYTNDDLHNTNANADEVINFENTKTDLNNCLHEALTEKLKPCRYYQPGQKLPVAQKEIKLFMLHVNIPSKHCIVGPMLARCSCQHLSTSDQRSSQCWGDAVLHQSPAFIQHWHSAAGRHRNLRRANNGGITFPTSARSWKTAAIANIGYIDFRHNNV